jgi:hypothetical protein
MEFSEINLKKISQAEIISNILDGNFAKPTNNEKKSIQNIITTTVTEGDYLSARNALILGIFFDETATFNNIKRKGLFRYSNYILKKCIISNLVKDILSIYSLLNLDVMNYIDYLNSIYIYGDIHKTYNDLHRIIIDRTNQFYKKYPTKSLIKTLLSRTDCLFLENHYPNGDDLRSLSSRTKEQISAATSYLIYFISNHRQLTVMDAGLIEEEFIMGGEAAEMIVSACFTIDFKEFEILIDYFNYTCKNENDKLKILSPWDGLEKSIRLGYIRTELQQVNDFVNFDKAASLDEFVDRVYESRDLDFFQLNDSYNYPRYTVKIPEEAYDFIVEDLFKPNSLFREEIHYLSHISKEQFININDIDKIRIRGELTLMDFIKMRRVFYLFYLLFSKKIYKEKKVETRMLFRSLIPMFKEEHFLKLFGRLTSDENIQTFLDILCWEPGSDILFDLQYHPIVYVEEHYLISLSIFANSNSIRNLYASEYKQNNTNILTDGTVDVVVDKLYSEFVKKKIPCFKQSLISKGEVDIFAIMEDTIFVFECKQSLHPTSIFDVRTMYDYILKAEKQLGYINSEFKKGELLSTLENKCNINLKHIKNIKSCIIVSNRLFCGNEFKYPVRNIHEISNIISTGIMRTEEGNFSLWEGRDFVAKDLENYLSMDNELVKHFYDSLSKRKICYNITSPIIEFETYYLDIEKARETLKKITSKMRKIK